MTCETWRLWLSRETWLPNTMARTERQLTLEIGVKMMVQTCTMMATRLEAAHLSDVHMSNASARATGLRRVSKRRLQGGWKTKIGPDMVAEKRGRDRKRTGQKKQQQLECSKQLALPQYG